jgi:hypothetical protein
MMKLCASLHSSPAAQTVIGAPPIRMRSASAGNSSSPESSTTAIDSSRRAPLARTTLVLVRTEIAGWRSQRSIR